MRDEFIRVCRWKLGTQYARVAEKVESNSDAAVQVVTEATFRLTDPCELTELRLRFGALQALSGVAMGVGSAVLALTYPEDYAVIDFRGWRQVFGENKTSFSVPNYQRYLDRIVRFAVELRWYPQEVDLAIWALDIDRNGKLPDAPPPATGKRFSLDADPLEANWIKFRALDQITPEQFLSTYAQQRTCRDFKCSPIYHLNKHRNAWLRDLDW
jgi:hypothetical protein